MLKIIAADLLACTRVYHGKNFPPSRSDLSLIDFSLYSYRALQQKLYHQISQTLKHLLLHWWAS